HSALGLSTAAGAGAAGADGGAFDRGERAAGGDDGELLHQARLAPGGVVLVDDALLRCLVQRLDRQPELLLVSLARAQRPHPVAHVGAGGADRGAVTHSSLERLPPALFCRFVVGQDLASVRNDALVPERSRDRARAGDMEQGTRTTLSRGDPSSLSRVIRAA